MKIEYYKTLKDEKTLKQYTQDAEEQLTTIFYNHQDNFFASRQYVDAFLIKQIYDIKGIEKHVMDALEKEIKYRIGRKLGKKGIELKRIENRIHSHSENPENTFYIGLNAELENRKILETQRERFSFNSGYDLEKIGIQLKKGNLFNLYRDKFLPIYKEKPKIEIKGEIYFNLGKEFDIMDLFHVLNNQEYHYRYDTLSDEKIDKELEEAIIQMFSFERNN